MCGTTRERQKPGGLALRVGEAVVITPRGRAVARIVPDARLRQAEIDRAIDDIKALRRRAGTIALDELLSERHEGREH